MQLSPITRMNLELTETMRGREKKGTLLWVLDKTETAMGKRLLRDWLERPLVDAAMINRRLDAVQALVNAGVERDELRAALDRVFDMERLLTRSVYGTASPRDVYALAQTCCQLPAVREMADRCGSPVLSEMAARIDPLEDIRDDVFSALDEEVPSTLKDGGVIRAGYSAEGGRTAADRPRRAGLSSQMEAKLKKETGIRTLKVGYNRVFGYYIEISKSFSDQVPASFVRKQTLANAERYITPELKDWENKILGANERLLVLERQLFEELLQRIAGQQARIQATADAVAQLDVLASLAQTAVENRYTRPEVDEGTEIHITEGRHPVIEQMLKGALFVPNDTLLDQGTTGCSLSPAPTWRANPPICGRTP